VRLLASAASGLLGALALVALLTLTRAGQLPHLGFLLEYPRLFGLGGWHAWPLRPYGFHVAAYFTFTAAIVVAVVRAGNRHEDALLTGMLAWIGSFGLIAGSYYVGESEPGNMLALFSAWFFALAMLVVVVARGLAARGWRRPTLMELTVLFGFALSLNAILQIPDPRFEVRRLRQHALSSPLIPETGSGTIAQWTKPGERVAILVQLSERIAYELGIVNVSPYMYAQAIPTRETLQNVIDAVRAEHVHKIFIEEQSTTPAQLALLRRAGFTEHGSGILMDVSE
jgi:hypothetical protein